MERSEKGNCDTLDDIIDINEISRDTEEHVPFDIGALADVSLYDDLGERTKFGEIHADYKTIFIFTRHLLCYTTKEYVEDLAKVSRESLRDAQVRLVLIACTNYKHMSAFRKVTKYPYHFYCDVDNILYERLGFEKKGYLGGGSIHVKSGFLRGMFNSTCRAVASGYREFQGNPQQQGGSLIVGPGNEVHFFHRDKHAQDHVPINDLLQRAGVRPVNYAKDRRVLDF